MSVLCESFGYAREDVAAAVQWRAADIVTTALDRLRPADRTVAAKIVAAQFVERCAASASAADWEIAAAWVDVACARYAGIIATQDVIGAALDGVAKTLASTPEADTARAFARVRHRLASASAVSKQPVRESNHHEAVDEIDIVLDGLLTRLDQSDVLTAEHSRAVGSWCARLAKRLGASKEDIVHLTRAGLVHDIGKVMTPNEILTAPRGLDDEEMAIMRRHAEEGAHIVLGVPHVAYLAPAVRNHHERFDGNGYPDRLKWEAIPHVARIVSVADAFNAMIGRRPYRPPMAPSRALEQLVQCRGEQFDPDVVDAMIDIVTNHGDSRL